MSAKDAPSTISAQERTALIARIRASHEVVKRTLGDAIAIALTRALDAGDDLLRLKKAAGHGGWLRVLPECSGLSERTAQHYMRLARNRAGLEAEMANPNRVSDLSLRRALGFTRSVPSSPQQKKRAPTPIDPQRRSAVECIVTKLLRTALSLQSKTPGSNEAFSALNAIVNKLTGEGLDLHDIEITITKAAAKRAA